MFKFLGHTELLEVLATSEEVVLFYDNGFVVLRLACGFNSSSIDGCYHDAMVDWEVGFNATLVGD
jgi:hypothetical protein